MSPQRLIPALVVGFTLIVPVAPASAQGETVRVVDPIFVPQPGWAVRKYGHPGLYFPERADRGRVIGGTVVMQCLLAAAGTLDGCEVVSETPTGYAFGYASIGMAEKRALTAAPRIVDGQAVGGEVVRLTIVFGHPGHPRRH